MKDLTHNPTNTAVSTTMAACEKTAIAARGATGVRIRLNSAPAHPTSAMVAATCIACLRIGSERASSPSTSSGSPKNHRNQRGHAAHASEEVTPEAEQGQEDAEENSR